MKYDIVQLQKDIEQLKKDVKEIKMQMSGKKVEGTDINVASTEHIRKMLGGFSTNKEDKEKEIKDKLSMKWK